MMRSNRLLAARILATGLFCVMLSGCGFTLIDTQPPPQIYDLEAPEMTSQGEPVDWQLIVEEPSAVRAFGTNRIALKRSDNSIQYYKGTRWSDRGPRLVQVRLIEALENTDQIMSVGSETSGINAKYRLKSSLRGFHAEFRGENTPTVVVSLSLKIVDNRSRDVVATTLLVGEVRAPSSKTSAVVKAFDEALKTVTRDAAWWVLTAGEDNKGT